MPLWTVVTCASVIGSPRMAFDLAASLASASAFVLLLPLWPVRVRDPARAAMSAADCAWVRATASMPTSMAKATNAIRPTRQTVTIGSTAPGRPAVLVGVRIGRLSSDDGVGGCASVGFAAHQNDHSEVHIRIHAEEGGNHGLVGS